MIRKIDNIMLLGTSHVAKQSVQEIKKTLGEHEDIEVVCLELDYQRFKSLHTKNKGKKKGKTLQMIKQYGVIIGLFLALLSGMQERVAKSLGVEPGIEMKAGYDEARKRKISTALIDRDIRLVMKDLAKLSMGRKIKMFFKLFATSFKKKYRQELNFDVKQGVPPQEFIDRALNILRIEVPDLYRILIHERNVHMVKRLVKLRESHEGKILAIVGAGHLKGMEELLKKELEQFEVKGNKVSYSYTIED
jgi:pheromone shutdown protein TraB